MGTDVILTKDGKEVSNLGRVDYRGLEAYYGKNIDEDYDDLKRHFNTFVIEKLLIRCKEDEVEVRASEIEDEIDYILEEAADIGRKRLISYMLEDEGVAIETDA